MPPSRDEVDSDDDDRSPCSEDPHSYSNPVKEEPADSKVKQSGLNEEKRSKLREIEVTTPHASHLQHWLGL